MDQGRKSITDSLDATPALLEQTDTREASFGWDTDDEGAFVALAEALLAERAVQTDVGTVAGGRSFEPSLVGLVTSEAAKGLGTRRGCPHPESAHTLNGCWADEPSPAFMGCDCDHRTWPHGFPRK